MKNSKKTDVLPKFQSKSENQVIVINQNKTKKTIVKSVVEYKQKVAFQKQNEENRNPNYSTSVSYYMNLRERAPTNILRPRYSTQLNTDPQQLYSQEEIDQLHREFGDISKCFTSMCEGIPQQIQQYGQYEPDMSINSEFSAFVQIE
ncbi:Hypothetical_protein [Hexamita inflata]|uniref:Hypothetical_protein n=1 Tax=Hexamita inflata TaxID=28002 RepID=A0ABP1HPL9_9EUKA